MSVTTLLTLKHLARANRLSSWFTVTAIMASISLHIGHRFPLPRSRLPTSPGRNRNELIWCLCLSHAAVINGAEMAQDETEHGAETPIL